jgi:ribose/xylose/arabinose/galactoside ABC-type transport system permease subunit
MSFVDRRRPIVRPVLPHLVWEGVLLVVLLLLTAIARAAEPGLFGGGTIWAQWAIIGFMAAAAAFSLRMGTPNLAIPALAALGGVTFVGGVNDLSPVWISALTAVIVCLTCGLALGVFVGLTGVPAWAASLGALALLQAFLAADSEGRTEPLRGPAISANVTWFLLFVFVSVLGAIALATPAVRVRLVSAGAGMSARLVTSLVGLGGSSALAGLAGVLLARRAQATVTVPFDLLLLALGVALIAGVGVYGGQGPIFGVVLASGIAAVIGMWNALAGRPSWSQLVLAGVLILLGLLVGWVIALINRRLPA